MVKTPPTKLDTEADNGEGRKMTIDHKRVKPYDSETDSMLDFILDFNRVNKIKYKGGWLDVGAVESMLDKLDKSPTLRNLND